MLSQVEVNPLDVGVGLDIFTGVFGSLLGSWMGVYLGLAISIWLLWTFINKLASDSFESDMSTSLGREAYGARVLARELQGTHKMMVDAMPRWQQRKYTKRLIRDAITADRQRFGIEPQRYKYRGRRRRRH